mgnify:CR=1 FL=1|jgi:alpha-amylase
MYNIRSTFNEERNTFHDTSILGNFIDNHDNPRFLNLQPSVTLMKGALTYAMTSEGIPIMYYGTEQLFNGGQDPYDREALWPTDLKKTDTYHWIARLNEVRT